MLRNPIVSELLSPGNPSSLQSNTMLVHVGGPVNMLATNKESSMIVVGGRTILKLYSIEETCFSEKMNMRVGRRQGLSLSCADVAWSHVNENVIATAATNGHIVLWDLNLMSRNKQSAEFVDHKRTVTKISFHSSEPGRLLSGSQDCTMKMFDTRKKECVASFASKNDGVRCVQFCPHEYFQFAASFDNGSVEVWDYRNTSTYLQQFIAHKGSVYTLEWHPDSKEKQCIATGGRDNKIKVWHTSPDHRTYEHVVIPTHSLVAMARWRPLRKEQIASVAMMLDHSIKVWDMRRPYVPFAHFTEHSDVTTGIVWKRGDPEILYSCSKDGTLYQHSMKDADRPAEHCNLSGLSLSCRGYLSYSSTDNASFTDPTPNVRNKGLFGFRNVVGVGVQSKPDLSSRLPNIQGLTNMKLAKFLNSKSDFAVHTARNKNDNVKPFNIINAAKSYKLRGMPFAILCDHNAKVAEQLGLFQDSCIWRHIQVLFEGLVLKKSERNNSSSFHSGSLEKNSLKTSREVPKNGVVTAESNGEESEQHSEPETEHYLTDIARGNATSEQDCYFSGDDDDMGDGDFNDAMSSHPHGFIHENWLPTEAIQQRSVGPENDGLEVVADSGNGAEDDGLVAASPIAIPERGEFDHLERWVRKNNNKKISSSSAPLSTSLSTVSPISALVHIRPIEVPYLQLHQKTDLLQMVFDNVLKCDSGIQVVTCAIIVLGHYCPSLELPIDKDRVEHWQSAYLNLVSKFELWNHHAEIMKLSNLHSIRSLNSASVLHSNCVLCNKRMSSSGRWICPKHRDIEHKQAGLSAGVKCALCHMAIKGLYTWCQGCCHGGHSACMEEWFKFPPSRGRCPTGCGHICTRCL